DIREGVLTRSVRFRWEGRTTHLTQRRFVSMDDSHVAALESTWEAEDWSGRLTIRTGLDGTVENDGVARYRELESRHLEPVSTKELDPETVGLTVRTLQSRVRIALAARTRAWRDGDGLDVERETRADEGRIEQELDVQLAEGETVTVEKVVALFTSRDHAISEAGLAARKAIRRAGGFSDLLRRHTLVWSQLWERAALETGHGEQRRTDRTVNLYMFHLLQTVSDHTRDLDVGVPARGWTGEAYRGHIFWDELFVLPVLNLRFPERTRSLLEY
ncbi:MAG: glycoside hydrolase family 65 protein, partial [Gammaproteobacteria bacterium]|nr:glycoside hydrolase family 65 protein [Gemmatimonadota bacterium]NIU80199.1 glycoside hydrolase family 65 protein [Gammaproteobacteria bacterium]